MKLSLLKRVEVSEWVRRQQAKTAGSRSTLVSPCELHPHWKVDVSDGRLPPSASECPACKASAMHDRSTERPERTVSNPVEISRATVTQEELAALWRERHPLPPGVVKPGSKAEEEALARIDQLREEEIERDRRKDSHAGILVRQAIEGGQLVQYLARGRGRIVRVTV